MHKTSVAAVDRARHHWAQPTGPRRQPPGHPQGYLPMHYAGASLTVCAIASRRHAPVNARVRGDVTKLSELNFFSIRSRYIFTRRRNPAPFVFRPPSQAWSVLLAMACDYFAGGRAATADATGAEAAAIATPDTACGQATSAATRGLPTGVVA